MGGQYLEKERNSTFGSGFVASIREARHSPAADADKGRAGPLHASAPRGDAPEGSSRARAARPHAMAQRDGASLPLRLFYNCPGRPPFFSLCRLPPLRPRV